jgi:hypothetical protein
MYDRFRPLIQVSRRAFLQGSVSLLASAALAAFSLSPALGAPIKPFYLEIDAHCHVFMP